MNAASYLRSLWAQSLQPPDQREIYDWAAAEGELPSSYAVTGQLDIATCPMVKGPLEALRRSTVRHVISMAGVQCLKTLIGELWLLWSIVNDPGPTQWLQTTDEEGKEHAKERFIPLLENFPSVCRLFSANRHDRTGRFIKFKHMYLRMEGAENRANVQRKSIKNQMRSEIWQSNYWKRGRLKEADSRLTQFVHNSKKYTESQPGWDAEFEVDDMHGTYLQGDQNVWHFTCQGCAKKQPYHWTHIRADGTRGAMRWDTTERTTRKTTSTNPDEKFRWSELIPTIRYECIYCGHRHYDDPLTRRRMSNQSEFIPQNPGADPAVCSFNWNQLAMPNLSWYRTEIGGIYNFLHNHAKALRGNEDPLRDFMMKVLAEAYNPGRHGVFTASESIDITSATQDEKTHALTFEGIRFEHRLMAVDVQADHFWIRIEIWSARGDSMVLWFEKVVSWDEVADRQARFHVPDQNVSVDISHRAQETKQECAHHGHWVQIGHKRAWLCWKAMRGSEQKSFAWTPRLGPTKGQRFNLNFSGPEWGDPCMGLPASDPKRIEYRGKQCPIYTWSNPTIKDIVINRRDGHAKGVKCIKARGPWNEEDDRQMHSQKKIQKDGRWIWVKFRDDHGFDCSCMNAVRADLLHLLAPQTLSQTSSPASGAGEASASPGEPAKDSTNPPAPATD